MSRGGCWPPAPVAACPGPHASQPSPGTAAAPHTPHTPIMGRWCPYPPRPPNRHHLAPGTPQSAMDPPWPHCWGTAPWRTRVPAHTSPSPIAGVQPHTHPMGPITNPKNTPQPHCQGLAPCTACSPIAGGQPHANPATPLLGVSSPYTLQLGMNPTCSPWLHCWGTAHTHTLRSPRTAHREGYRTAHMSGGWWRRCTALAETSPEGGRTDTDLEQFCRGLFGSRHMPPPTQYPSLGCRSVAAPTAPAPRNPTWAR